MEGVRIGGGSRESRQSLRRPRRPNVSGCHLCPLLTLKIVVIFLHTYFTDFPSRYEETLDAFRGVGLFFFEPVLETGRRMESK